MGVAFGASPVPQHGVGSVLAPRLGDVIIDETTVSQEGVDAHAALCRMRGEIARVG